MIRSDFKYDLRRISRTSQFDIETILSLKSRMDVSDVAAGYTHGLKFT